MPKILFLGDIVGKPGREAVARHLPALKAELGASIVVANGENAASGAGLTSTLAKEILSAGVDAITLGDHVWDQRGFDAEIGSLDQVCRPANLPASCPGRTHLIVERDGFRLGIATVLGRSFMNLQRGECPFLSADAKLRELKAQTDGVLMEIHAEATSEKIAFGWYLDGRASIVVGTHTHVPTADASILPRGTAYLTDAGMCGPYASVLGREVQPVVAKFLDGMPRKFEVATGDPRISGLLVELSQDGIATSAELVHRRVTL